jgi:hypothetical protein
MISGGLMLSRQDSWKKILSRVLRVVLALLGASYLYFLYDAWVNWGLWPRAFRLDILLGKIIRMEITDGFWYLYFYIAILLTLPLWQWLHRRMTQQQRLRLIAFCFSLNAALPLIGHYVPRLSLLENPLLPYVPLGYLGLLFAGDQVLNHLTIQKRSGLYAVIAFVAALIFAWLLTWLEFYRIEPGQKYWFMDHRMVPALPVIVEAISLMVLGKCIGERVQADDRPSAKSSLGSRIIAELGGCAFGIYLAQDLIIAETETRLFLPLCEHIPPMIAALIWEAVVFAIALVGIWLLRRIPLLRKIL